VFRAELDRRREKISQAVATDIVGRAGALAELSLDVLYERIRKDGDALSLRGPVTVLADPSPEWILKGETSSCGSWPEYEKRVARTSH
jgi:hypothetical protein